MKNFNVSSFVIAILAVLIGLAVLSLTVLTGSSKSTNNREQFEGFVIPKSWTRQGLVIERYQADRGVSGDPCIVWDEDIQGWRMVLFYDPWGCAHAICTNLENLGPGQWKVEGRLNVTNLEVMGGFHKPFFVMDPYRPNYAAKIDGRYCLLVVSTGRAKQVWRGWSEKLAGPWTFESQPIITIGDPDDFDARHADTITGYYFPDRKEFLYFYKGYPLKAQPRKISPFGSAQAVATQKLDEPKVTKRGIILEPEQQAGHWASGWVGGLQLMRGRDHRWIGLVNASPTPPDYTPASPTAKEVWNQEPPPSQPGFAWTDEEWPVKGWKFAPEPIEWVKDIPQSALDWGEGYNLWRHFIHILPDGRTAMFYNSGYYGKEQLYMKVSDK